MFRCYDFIYTYSIQRYNKESDSVPVVRYIQRHDDDYVQFPEGVFAFPYFREDIQSIDEQAKNYFLKTDGKHDRVYGTMDGWFFKIANYEHLEGFGDMTFEPEKREHCMDF